MAKEEWFPVGIWNIPFGTETMLHSYVHFLGIGKVTCSKTLKLTKNHFVHFSMIKSILLNLYYNGELKKMYHNSNDKKFEYMNTTFMAWNNVYCSRETDKALKVQDFLRR